jgi:hypothetical protein
MKQRWGISLNLMLCGATANSIKGKQGIHILKGGHPFCPDDWMTVGSSTYDSNLRRGGIHQTDLIASSAFVNATHTFQLRVALLYLIRSSYTLWCRGCFFFILIILQTVGLLRRVISSSQGLYLNTE